MAAADSVRAFVAIDPAEALRRELQAMQDRLRSACGAAGWKVGFPAIDAIHLTLKFLGDVPSARLNEIVEALSPLGRTDRLQIALGGLGAFPERGRPKILWVGLSAGQGAVKSLAEQVDRYLAPLGFPPEGRQFSPHFTVGRVKRATAGVTTVLKSVSPAGGGPSPIEEVVLYRSDLHPSGARYTVLGRIGLGAG